MNQQHEEDRLTNPDPETLGREPQTAETERLPIARLQASEPEADARNDRTPRLEDRLMLASFPLLVLALIFWAIASAYPTVGTAFNLLSSIAVILITCVLLISCIELSWTWMKRADTQEAPEVEASAYGWATIGMWALICVLIGCLIATTLSAGQASAARTILIVIELVFLAIQCWRLLWRAPAPTRR